MKLKSTLLLAILLTVTSTLFAQKPEPVKPALVKPAAVKLPTVQEILAKYVKAIGGREANEKIKTRFVSGSVELLPMGIKGTFETYSAGEAKSFTKMNLAGIGDMLEGYDGKTGWVLNPIQGSRDKAGAELAQAKINYNFYREINLDKLFSKMELKGVEKVGEKDTYVIVATAEGIPTETWYFDTVSGLLLRSDTTLISPESNHPAKVFYDEMRTVDGVTVPVKIRTQMPQFEIVMISTDVKHGVAIEETKFAKPKQ
jgi:zinc protease